MRDLSSISALLFLFTTIGACQTPDILSTPDTATAVARWTPQFGSLPPRVETLPDGSVCLALDAVFEGPMDRACWDWTGTLDLSAVRHLSFECSSTTGGLDRQIGVYFGTPNGWYVGWCHGIPAGSWREQTLRLGSLGTEGEPDGWDRVTTFRFSVWADAPGKTTFYLRNFRTVAADPQENYLKNGSFEITGGGMPYAWGSGHWGVGNLPWATDMDLWRRHWFVDETVAKEGTNSLCIHNTADLPLLRAVSVWLTPPKTSESNVLSAWLRSDQDSLPVTLDCSGTSGSTKVGREWTQLVVPNVPRKERCLVSVIPEAPGKLWIDAVQLQSGPEAAGEFHPSFDDAGLAAREAAVDWSPPRRTEAVAAGRSITGRVSRASARIDADGRFLLNGVPYVQHSFGLEFVGDPAILDYVAQIGFRDICIQIRETVTTEELTAVFDRCAEAGLRLIPWLDGRITRERFSQHITALKDHPALLCWYVMDEPSGDAFAEADARLQIAHELDPRHPAFINYLGNKLEDQSGDIYSTDVYPIPHSTPMGAISAVARMKAAAEIERKPVWMWLQGTGYAYWMDREPTPRELSCMVYGSLIAGARGIYYFAQVPRTKACLDEMRAMCVEVDEVAPAIYSLEEAPAVSIEASGLMCESYRKDGRLWVLAVNTQNVARDVELRMDGVGGELEVVFEDRTVQAAEGKWTDSFGPYERHVYRVAAP